MKWLGCWTHDQEIVSSTPSRRIAGQQLWATCTHPCASVTKQYNLVPAKGRWCSAAGKVTVGLASHWPCVTDSMSIPGLSTYGINGQCAGDEHHTYVPLQHAPWPLYVFTQTSTNTHSISRSVLYFHLSSRLSHRQPTIFTETFARGEYQWQ